MNEKADRVFQYDSILYARPNDNENSLANRQAMWHPMYFSVTSSPYRIRLQGIVDESWSDYLDGLTITGAHTADRASVTILTGRLVDQAALIGVLNNVYDLGFHCRRWSI